MNDFASFHYFDKIFNFLIRQIVRLKIVENSNKCEGLFAD